MSVKVQEQIEYKLKKIQDIAESTAFKQAYAMYKDAYANKSEASLVDAIVGELRLGKSPDVYAGVWLGVHPDAVVHIGIGFTPSYIGSKGYAKDVEAIEAGKALVPNFSWVRFDDADHYNFNGYVGEVEIAKVLY